MQWRSFVMLSVGLAVMLLVSFLGDSPYPRPVRVYASKPARMVSEPNEIILTITDDHLYQTSIWFETPLTGSEETPLQGTGPLKSGVVGVIQQRRKPLITFCTNNSAVTSDVEWTLQFQHTLTGPISKISHASPVHSAATHHVQFAVLYHVLQDEDPQHIARVFYWPTEPSSTMEYKDLVFPGTTWIDSFDLEDSSIIYSRDPDQYRFRIAHLPPMLTDAPHATTLNLDNVMPGERVRRYHQPRNTQQHIVTHARIYSPNQNTYRVLSVDSHKTKSKFYSNMTITDGNLSTESWTRRDGWHDKDDVYSDDGIQYIAFVDGTHQVHHDRMETKMPHLNLARSRDGLTAVVPYIKNKFMTIDFTDRLDVLQHDEDEKPYIYRHKDGSVLPEYFFWDRVTIEGSSEHETIAGTELDEDGSLLAAWTDTNVIYIHQREKHPYRQIRQHDWFLSMVVAPTQGELDAAVSEM
ncbi:hypothetical protein BX666DRAFT_1886097 [Dichotomocladium elegans]|nr:hypothetical protein BX666DRAFT_1886097 [Dichotomocladium elegans]